MPKSEPRDTSAPDVTERSFPVVCLGLEAGGLRRLVALIRHIAPDTGIGLVIFNQMRRNEPRLPQILRKCTPLPVSPVASGLHPEPHHIYLVPPNQGVRLEDGAFSVSPVSGNHEGAITAFLESAAREWKGKAVAIAPKGTVAEDAWLDPELPPEAVGEELARIAREGAPVDEDGSAADTKAATGKAEKARRAFPVVGVGASAGGLEALGQLLEHLPRKTGMAFVLIQHMDPRHTSQLAEILQTKTAMRVREVSGDTPVEPDCVYVMPAGRNLTVEDGILKTIPRPDAGRPNMPVDLFLQALAKDRHSEAIGVVLSGTATDGSLGLRTIKAEDGITFAQEPDSAKFPGMPRSAISTASVDFVLPPDKIARQLVKLTRHSHVRPGRAHETDFISTNDENLNQIFARLRAVSGTDFSYYKRSTSLRRIKRRMAVHGVEEMPEYARIVEQNEEEALELAQDFLINVTSFFREPEAHHALKEIVFPALVGGRSAEDPIRIWIPACSTGEEAYSLAISLVEFLEERGEQQRMQIFATDLSEKAIEKARAGVYLESAVANVSPERLHRFFVRRGRVYQIAQAIREFCVFARHDLTEDPPFSKMDLISCCNLLIYLGPILQRRCLSTFHYALKPNGFLLLGTAESAGASSEQFAVIDQKQKIYARRGGTARSDFAGRPNRPMTPWDGTAATERFAGPSNSQRETERILLAEYVPPSITIDESMNVLQIRGKTDAWLQIPEGKPTTELSRMMRPGLLGGLSEAVKKARKERLTVVEKGLQIREAGQTRTVNLRVIPIPGANGRNWCFIVLFEESNLEDTGGPPAGKTGRRTGRAKQETVDKMQREIDRLEQELAATKDYLQSVTETHEATSEELRSFNEEVQATNEELDTAKEELQASNEELNTVNEELRAQNAGQSSLNNDLRRLLESINIPLIMVGKDMRIRWFTAAMEPLLNLLPTDQGRAITDLRATAIPNLSEMLVRALSGEEGTTTEIRRPNGRWVSLRIRSYRAGDNSIDGAIATLIDIDDLKRARDFAEAVVETVQEPLIVLDSGLLVRAANDSFYRKFQTGRQEVEGHRIYEICNGEWNIPKLRELLESVLPAETWMKDFEVEHVYENLGSRTMLLNAREIRQQDGERMILLAIDDITELRRSSAELRRTNEDLKQFIFAASHDLQEPVRIVVAHTQLLASRYGHALDPGAKISMDYAVAGALRMEALISGLREFWQVSERAEEPRTPVDCNAALQKAMLNLEGAIAENKATITSDRLPSLKAAETPLIQLFQNLLGNAIKYRSTEPPKVHISAERNSAEWIFSVRDNGIGIDPKYAAQVFGVFKRLHGQEEYSGTGIGLAICQKIVERYGGRIWVESTPGGGATFRFTMPASGE